MGTTSAGRRPERVARLGVLAAVGLLVAGCAGSPGAAGPPSPTTAEPGGAATGPAVVAAGDPDLSAEVVQYRRDAQRDVVQVKVTNHGEQAVHVERVEVVSPTFVSPSAVDKDSTVGAGLSVDLTVPLADPACPGPGPGEAGTRETKTTETGATETKATETGATETGATEGTAAGHTAVLAVDGTTLELPVEDRVLQQVRSQRCAEAAVGDLVTLAWQPAWQDAGEVEGRPGLRGRLVATPAATGGAVPVGLSVGAATTLFSVAEPVAVTVVDVPVALEVAVTVTRCDAHAIAEDKKGYLFPVRVRAGGGDEVVVEVAVPVPERVALQDLIDRTCR